MNNEIEFYIKAIEDRKRELQNSTWLQQTYAKVDSAVGQPVKEIRCLALGSIADFVNPRFQLAFLLLIASRLNVSEISAWDPAFQEADKLVLEHYNIKVSQPDPSPVDSLLWYVPHGPFSVVVKLPSILGRSIYIGNDLSSFPLDDKPERSTVEDYRRHASIQSIVPQKSDRWLLAFSSTAVHVHD